MPCWLNHGMNIVTSSASAAIADIFWLVLSARQERHTRTGTLGGVGAASCGGGAVAITPLHGAAALPRASLWACPDCTRGSAVSRVVAPGR